jgi:hypothetical protein
MSFLKIRSATGVGDLRTHYSPAQHISKNQVPGTYICTRKKATKLANKNKE